jgi:hypothetical protein
MQFNRSALVAAIDKAIQQDQAAIDAVAQRNNDLNEQYRVEWLAQHQDAWTKAAVTIRAKLRKGQPVVQADIPRDRSGYGGMAFYQAKRGEATPVRAAELAGLRAVLAAVSDDTITSTALRSLGVGVNTLRLIVPLLGEATVRSENVKATG